jgi:hypothetical protein
MKFSYSQGSRLLTLLCFIILSAYIVYKQATDKNAVDLDRQVVRHEQMLIGNSEFFNPWQYRIFSTYTTEVFYQVLHSVTPKIDRGKAFLIFRFFQNLLIFYLATLYFKAINIKNPWLILAGILLMSFFMAHSVFQSDLSFNTYFDILFYLLAAWLILKQKYTWIIPLMFVGALNRETSLLIPAMLVLPFIQWKERKIPRAILVPGLLSTLVFFVAFISVRVYYGYRAPEGINGMTSVSEYLLFNLRFFRLYPELIGTLAFLPLVIIIFLKRLPRLLQYWFWIICPAWFGIHFVYSTAVETRLFLVPQILVFIPAFLWLIENWYTHEVLKQKIEHDHI